MLWKSNNYFQLLRFYLIYSKFYLLMNKSYNPYYQRNKSPTVHKICHFVAAFLKKKICSAYGANN